MRKRDKKLKYWRMGTQSGECLTGELGRLHVMTQKSELLRKLLVEAEVSVDSPDYWWLIDGRPDYTQFTEMPEAKYAETA